MKTGARDASFSQSSTYPLEHTRFQFASFRALKIISQIFSVCLDVSQNFYQSVDLPLAASLIIEFVMRLSTGANKAGH